MKREVRILLVGDEQVGKTSLITSLLTESFAPNVPHVLPEVALPPEIGAQNVNTFLIDSSARPEDRSTLEHEIRRAHVICVVYSVTEPAGYARISAFWLPYIRALGVNVPVVVVGARSDLAEVDLFNEKEGKKDAGQQSPPGAAQSRLQKDALPLMNEFKEVETCLECSAKAMVNVLEVFYFAQKAVLNPTSPLYDGREQELKPKCIVALRRIFALCDRDKDGALSDDELNAFQVKCFGTPLQLVEIEGIKDVIEAAQPDGITEDGMGITVEGFLYLHRLFIQRGRLETTWTVLREFGYGDDLTLRDDFLHPPMSVPEDAAVELSPRGYQFLTELFAVFDFDQDGALCWSELENLFATAPENPWLPLGFPETTLINENHAVTLQGFLAQWTMTTLIDHRKTLAYLAYLGYPSSDTTAALKIIPRARRLDRPKDRQNRDVFLCYVLGPIGSGKTSLMRNFINRNFSEAYLPTQDPTLAVNAIDDGGREKYLVMEEIGPQCDVEILSDDQRLARCDVLCYVYDCSDPNSFGYIAKLRKKFPLLERLPSVVVASKSDRDLVPQRFEQRPDEYCAQHGLPPPVCISVKDGQTADLYHTLLVSALDPSLTVPNLKKRPLSEMAVNAAVASAAVGVLVVGVLVAMRLFRSQQK